MRKIIAFLSILLLLEVGFVCYMTFFKTTSDASVTEDVLNTQSAQDMADIDTQPTEENVFMSADQLWEVTWEEFEAMSPSQKELFFDSFASVEEFDQWMQWAKQESIPWENGGKLPEEYTWEEYEALSPAQKELFFDYFDSSEAFDAWLQEAQKRVYLPWADGGKQPWEYTWEEYEALTTAQKEAFFDAFGSAAAFDTWMRSACGVTKPTYPWEAGGKQPEEYTWEEYEALTPGEKDAFFDSFESVEAFDAWMENAVNASLACPWENGGKQPCEYTWEEYEALTPAQKELFFDSFASWEEFQAWMERVNP